MKIIAMSVLFLPLAGLVAGDLASPNWNENVWDAKMPVLATPVADAELHGRLAGTERITPENAAGDETKKAWKATAWRNERVNAQFVVWSGRLVNGQGERHLRARATALKGPDGAEIPADALRVRFVRYVRGSLIKGTEKVVPEGFWGDCLDDPATSDRGWIDMPKNGFRPVWLTVTVPADAKPGVYTGELEVRAAGDRTVTFPLELKVRNETLPEPAKWAFFLDLWQHPWAVARQHGVVPFSEDHLRLMEPLLKELAGCGQKTITTTITDLPWNHQNFDAYRTMVEHVKEADGSWRHDYALFDRYVTFAAKCGLGPQIHCYTMASWGNIVYYTDGATGDKVPVKLEAGTPEHEAFWGPFLQDFRRHLQGKGWLGRTYIALDERTPKELAASVACLKKYAPEIRIMMAGNRSPSEFKGIEIDNYSSAMAHATKEFLAEIGPRRAAGKVTTFYICCGPARPNTFIHSPLEEVRWLGLYAAAKGYDGMLRWAVFNWTREPFYDTTLPGHRGDGWWSPGDTYLLYPGARTSVRWETFRDSVENFEKIRALRAAGRTTPELEEALKGLNFDGSTERRSAASFGAEADRIERAIDAASRTY